LTLVAAVYSPVTPSPQQKENLRFEKLFFGSLNVSHAEVLKHGQFHRIYSVMELFYINQTQASEKSDAK